MTKTFWAVLCGGGLLVCGLVLVVQIKVEEVRTCQVLLQQQRRTIEAERKFFHHGPIVSAERPYSLYPPKP